MSVQTEDPLAVVDYYRISVNSQLLREDNNSIISCFNGGIGRGGKVDTKVGGVA